MPLGADSIPCNDPQALFDLCNARYYNGALQPSEGFEVRYYAAERQLGRFRACPHTHRDLAIELSTWLREHPLALRSAMVREMIPMLALQSYRETGDARFLDQEPLYGHLFIEPGIGAFFLAQLEHLNLAFPELGLTVKPRFGSGSLFDQRRIPTARLLVIPVNPDHNTGAIYRLHDKAATRWTQLLETAWVHHATQGIQLLRVAGALAEAFPMLRKDNQPRANARARLEENFDMLVQEIRDHRLTTELTAPNSLPAQPPFSEPFAHWHPEAYSGY